VGSNYSAEEGLSSPFFPSISSVIGGMMGTTQDPVDGAYHWVGGAGSQGGIAKNPTLNNATNVTSGTGNGQRYHTFYSLLNE
jgi:hypothetical protein